MAKAANFETYMLRADCYCIKLTGLSVYDLPDWNWMDCFEDEINPKEAVRDLLEEQGYSLEYI